MTIEEVVWEMRKHLDERQRPEDELVPAAHWAELLDEPVSRDTFKRRVQKQPGGGDLWAAYVATRKVRLEAMKQALRAASVEGRSVYAEGARWGRQLEQGSLRRWGVQANRAKVNLARLWAVAKRGMTLREWADAAGCRLHNIYTNLQRGKLERMVVLRPRQRPNDLGWQYVIKQVLRGD